MSSYSFQGRTRVWVPREEEENLRIFGNGKLDGFMPMEIPAKEEHEDDYENERWPPKLLIKLLRLYGSHRCLWDHNDPCNKNRNERRAAMIDITTAMGSDITMEQVTAKINVIRSTYRYEKRRIKQRIRKGLGAKTKLKWFALADSFLRNVPRSEKFRKTEASPDSDSDLEDTIVFTIDPEIMIPIDDDLTTGTQNFITADIPQSRAERASKASQANAIHKKVAEINKVVDDSKRVGGHAKISSTMSMEFLKLYRSFKCLWDANVAEYRDNGKRDAAIEAISVALGGKLSRKQVIKKINALRSLYRAERRVAMQRINRGETWRPRLKWYPLADSFLRPFCQEKVKKDFEPTNVEHLEEEPPEIECEEIDCRPGIMSDGDDIEATEIDIADIPEVKIEVFSGDEADFKSSNAINSECKGLNAVIKPITRHWTENESLQFVELYKKQRCLWDFTDKNFGRMPEKEAAIKNIATDMDFPLEKIKKKIKIFKKAYRMEVQKLEKSERKGICFSSEYIWFPLAQSFLNRNDEPSDDIAPTYFVDSAVLPSPFPANGFSELRSPLSVLAPTHKVKTESPDDSSHMEMDRDAHCDEDDFYMAEIDSDNASKKCNRSSVFLVPSVPHIKVEDEVKLPQVGFNSKVTHSTLTRPIVSSPVQSEQSVEISEPVRIKWNPPEDDLLEGKWSLKSSVKFLRVYGAHRCLWDLNHPDYRNRAEREAAMADIAAVMGQGMDVEFVNKKIKTFRITYMQERRRMVDLMKQKQDPEIQLKWFPLVDSFLRPHIGLRAFKNDEPQLPQFDYQFVFANLNLIDPKLLNNFVGKGTQNSIQNETTISHSESESDGEFSKRVSREKK